MTAATPVADDSQGMNYLVSLPRRVVTVFIPLSVFLIVLGGQEVTDQTVALQSQNGEKVGTFPIDDVIVRLLEEIAEKRLPSVAATPAAG